MTQAGEKYKSDCLRINSYTAQASLMQGKELEKIHTRLERAQQTVQANERDYANFAKNLQITTAEWEQDWKVFCDSCQDQEEERMEFMKDTMWAYANAVSTVCVSDDEVSKHLFITGTLVLRDLSSLARRCVLPWNRWSLIRTWRTSYVTMGRAMLYQTRLPSSTTTPPKLSLRAPRDRLLDQPSSLEPLRETYFQDSRHLHLKNLSSIQLVSALMERRGREILWGILCHLLDHKTKAVRATVVKRKLTGTNRRTVRRRARDKVPQHPSTNHHNKDHLGHRMIPVRTL